MKDLSKNWYDLIYSGPGCADNAVLNMATLYAHNSHYYIGIVRRKNSNVQKGTP